MKPRMFIGSSTEHLDLAYAAQEGLEHDVEVTVWSQGIFGLSRTAMASLVDVAEESDFGLFILAPSDVTSIRDAEHRTVRDNVVFELGLFIGELGVERCFMFTPRGADDLHLPSDLLGLTPATYEADRQDGNLVAALGPACNRVRKSVVKLGSRTPVAPTTIVPTSPQAVEDELTSDPVDCVALIQSWMGSRPASKNTNAIRYAEVDRELKLVPGAAERFIEQAAARWNYVADQKGKDVILFRDRDGGGVVVFGRTDWSGY
jgi:hypothetical protein